MPKSKYREDRGFIGREIARACREESSPRKIAAYGCIVSNGATRRIRDCKNTSGEPEVEKTGKRYAAADRSRRSEARRGAVRSSPSVMEGKVTCRDSSVLLNLFRSTRAGERHSSLHPAYPLRTGGKTGRTVLSSIGYQTRYVKL